MTRLMKLRIKVFFDKNKLTKMTKMYKARKDIILLCRLDKYK